MTWLLTMKDRVDAWLYLLLVSPHKYTASELATRQEAVLRKLQYELDVRRYGGTTSQHRRWK